MVVLLLQKGDLRGICAGNIVLLLRARLVSSDIKHLVRYSEVKLATMATIKHRYKLELASGLLPLSGFKRIILI